VTIGLSIVRLKITKIQKDVASVPFLSTAIAGTRLTLQDGYEIHSFVLLVAVHVPNVSRTG